MHLYYFALLKEISDSDECLKRVVAANVSCQCLGSAIITRVIEYRFYKLRMYRFDIDAVTPTYCYSKPQDSYTF